MDFTSKQKRKLRLARGLIKSVMDDEQAAIDSGDKKTSFWSSETEELELLKATLFDLDGMIDG